MTPSSCFRSVILAVALLSSWRAASGQPLVERETYIVQYSSPVREHQERTLGAIGTALGRAAAPVHRYSRAFQGLALELTGTEADAVAALPGVARVLRSRELRPLSDAGPAWIGARGIWKGTTTGGLPGTEGEGVVIGILDTGINMDHPSFADVGGDGYDHVNPRGSGNYVGWCRPSHPKYSPSRACNDKLIGAWSWPEAGDNPEDDRGHGSLVASVAAGNHTTAKVFYPGGGIARPVSGVAPHANLISYDVCGTGCQESTVLAAIDQAVEDGVDVLNLSFGTAYYHNDPWDSPVAMALLGARVAGIVVTVPAHWVAGPHDPPFLQSPGTAPWVLAASASTHNRRLTSVLTGWRDGEASPSLEIRGKGLTSAYGPAPVVYGQCHMPPPPGTFDGEVAYCSGSSVQETALELREAGAGGMIHWVPEPEYDVPEAPLAPQPSVLPVVQIEALFDAWNLSDWLQTGNGHRASISATAVEISPEFADVMPSSSSAGYRIKPDLVAPGVDILGAFRDPEKYQLASGTSMASAHVAGAAALVRALHPDWTVAEVHSALATTARMDVLVRRFDGEEHRELWDGGFGRLDLGTAGRAGLVLDHGAEAFRDPVTASSPALNVPWLRNYSCYQTCTWTRTVRSTLPVVSHWTAAGSLDPYWPGPLPVITPGSFTLPPGGVQTLEIRMPSRGPHGYFFGNLLLTEVAGKAAQAHLPLLGYIAGDFDLQVTKAGAGSGRVVSSPAGIDCGADCTGTYREDTIVTLTATAEPGSVRLGWTGGGCYGPGPVCQVTVDRAVAVTAHFGVPAPDQPITNGVPVEDSVPGPVAHGAWKYYWFDVESGVRELIVDLENLSGVARLYLRHGEKPDGSRWDCTLVNWGSSERCRMDRPAAGRWWIGITSEFETYGDNSNRYRIQATWAPVLPTDFHTITPCRVLDTRQTYFAMINSFPRTFPVAGLCGIPATATAVVANITALDPQSSGSVRFYAEDLGLPPMESLYFLAGKTRANQIFLRLTGGSGTTGAVAELDQGGTVHVLLDVFGYFE